MVHRSSGSRVAIKLSVAFLCVCGITAVLGWTSIRSFREVAAHDALLYEDGVVALRQVREVERSFTKFEAGLIELVASRKATERLGAIAALRKASSELSSSEKALQSHLSTPAVPGGYEEFVTNRERLSAIQMEIEQVVHDGSSTEKARGLIGEATQICNAMARILQDIATATALQAKRRHDEGKTAAAQATLLLALLTLVAVASSAGFGLASLHLIAGPGASPITALRGRESPGTTAHGATDLLGTAQPDQTAEKA